MPNREKVIQAMEWCKENACEGCPYDTHNNESCGISDDILALLKEQEPLAVYEGKVNKCVCGNGINRYWHPEYCGFCGKKLEWY